MRGPVSRARVSVDVAAPVDPRVVLRDPLQRGHPVLRGDRPQRDAERLARLHTGIAPAPGASRRADRPGGPGEELVRLVSPLPVLPRGGVEPRRRRPVRLPGGWEAPAPLGDAAAQRGADPRLGALLQQDGAQALPGLWEADLDPFDAALHEGQADHQHALVRFLRRKVLERPGGKLARRAAVDLAGPAEGALDSRGERSAARRPSQGPGARAPVLRPPGARPPPGVRRRGGGYRPPAPAGTSADGPGGRRGGPQAEAFPP